MHSYETGTIFVIVSHDGTDSYRHLTFLLVALTFYLPVGGGARVQASR